MEKLIPTVSGKVAASVFREFLTSPREAARTAAENMDRQNLPLLTHTVSSALNLMGLLNERAASWRLLGSMFFYECCRQQAVLEGIPLTAVDGVVLDELDQYDYQQIESMRQAAARMDLRGVMQIKQEIREEFVAFRGSLHNGNPVIESCIRQIDAIEKQYYPASNLPASFSAEGGVFYIHRALTKHAENKPDNEITEKHPLAKSISIPVGQSPINRTLIEIIFGSKQFCEDTLRFIQDAAPDWRKHLDELVYPDLSAKYIHQLFTSLVIDSYRRELATREIPFPAVSRTIINDSYNHDADAISLVLRPGPTRINQVIRKMEVLKQENPRLYDAYTSLLLAEKILHGEQMHKLSYLATADANSHIRNKRESEYWEHMLT